MPPVSRAPVDVCTGHGCFPPRNTASGSPNVITNGYQTMRIGDPYQPHGCPPSPPHGGVAAGGSGTVLVNNRGVHRIGDAVSCGSSSATGSGNVIAGG